MVRKKKAPKKVVCPGPVLAVKTKQRQLPHRRLSQNLFGRFPAPAQTNRTLRYSFFVPGNRSSRFRNFAEMGNNFTTPTAQGIPLGNTTMGPLFAP